MQYLSKSHVAKFDMKIMTLIELHEKSQKINRKIKMFRGWSMLLTPKRLREPKMAFCIFG